MKNIIYLFFCIPFFAISQNSNAKIVSNKNSILANFSETSIVAYQDGAVEKIEDFYSYLNLYAQTSNANVKNEIKANIEAIFLNQNLILTDIVEGNEVKKTMQELLEKFKNTSTHFETSNFKKEMDLNGNFFLIHYDLQVKNRENKQYKIHQKVYFFPSMKNFGTAQKNVWQLKLGEF